MCASCPGVAVVHATAATVTAGPAGRAASTVAFEVRLDRVQPFAGNRQRAFGAGDLGQRAEVRGEVEADGAIIALAVTEVDRSGGLSRDRVRGAVDLLASHVVGGHWACLCSPSAAGAERAAPVARSARMPAISCSVLIRLASSRSVILRIAGSVPIR